MALDYKKCAEEIFREVGGRENLVSAAHCATRLRLVTVDNSKVSTDALENIDGVKGVFKSNGQLQLIIGTGTVNKVYDEFLAVSGKVVPQSEIPDETFSSGVLGQGFGVVPSEGVVYAPCDGVISTVAETKHAVGISAANDMELLIHVGVDTVKMNGKGFKVLVREEQSVKKGDRLMEFDIAAIKAAGFSDTVVVLLTNSDDYENVQIEKTGDLKAGEEMISVG